MTVEHHYRGSGLDCLTSHQSFDPLVLSAVAAWDGTCSTCHPEMIDGDGNVILVLEDYQTIQLPTPIPDDIAAELTSVYSD